ncbi:hypothetical protein ACTJKC_02790 [Pedobacter sp. 22226]|uniref:hypothetical protein n=1 Tax=Pedobacter sp. 22226 TaxID=3453894 RepID=UPI003F8495A5
MSSLFSEIKSLPSKGGWKINIVFQGEEKIIVSVLIETDIKGRPLPPMLLKGGTDELERAFFEVVATPVANTMELFGRRQEYDEENENKAESKQTVSCNTKTDGAPASEQKFEEET